MTGAEAQPSIWSTGSQFRQIRLPATYRHHNRPVAFMGFVKIPDYCYLAHVVKSSPALTQRTQRGWGAAYLSIGWRAFSSAAR